MIIETPWRLDGTGVVYGTGTFSSKWTMELEEEEERREGRETRRRSVLVSIPENPLALPSEMRHTEKERERERSDGGESTFRKRMKSVKKDDRVIFFFFLNEYLIYTVDGYPAVR